MKSVRDLIQQGDRFFRWRGAETSRLEALFDMVLAMALTLTVISMEVPQTFDDLVGSFAKLPSFAVCFLILLMCWYYHFQFHRRFGIENFPLIILSGLLLFIILIYVYPLKFLYSVLFAPDAQRLNPAQGQTLIALYSAGFAAIFIMFGLMHSYAYLYRVELGLNQNEIVLTKSAIGTHLVYAGVACLSILMIGFQVGGTWSGWVYLLIGPLQFANGWYWGQRIIEPVASAAETDE
ncbi:MAG: DUF1211 domain-containing protein [Planctomycetaceae bacterium]|nr:DUF1211 domain-containing protein [Planctomycetaceae bacterium]